MEGLVLAIDVGTSSLKAALINEVGEQKSYAHVPFKLIDGKVSASTWKDALSQACLTMALAVGQSYLHPEAIVVSGHGPSMVLLDKNDSEVGSVLMWHDQNQIRKDDTTSFFLPKLAYFRDHQRHEFKDLTTVLSCPEYLIYLLSGEKWTLVPNERYEPFYWTPKDIGAYGFDGELFAPLNYTGHYCGTVSAKASKVFALAPDVPVIAGGPDFIMSLIGTNCLKPGMCTDRAGSSEGINYCANSIRTHKELRTLPHLAQGHYNVARIMPASGMLFEWFRSITGQESKSYIEMLENIVSIGTKKDYPFFIPDPHARGMFSQAQFVDLEPSHNSAHVSRAVVESIAFIVRESVDILEIEGLGVEELRMCGGQAKNPLWCQLKSQLINKPIWVPQVEDAELLGNAAVAHYCLGTYRSIEDASQNMVKRKKLYEPQKKLQEETKARYEAWLSKRNSLSEKN